MKGTVDFLNVKSNKFRKNDYIVLKTGVIGKIKYIDNNYIHVFVPNNNVEKQIKVIVTLEDIEYKMQLWVLDLHGESIAPLSYQATHVKKGDLVNGWVKKVYYDKDKYHKYFVVKCPFCRTVK